MRTGEQHSQRIVANKAFGVGLWELSSDPSR